MHCLQENKIIPLKTIYSAQVFKLPFIVNFASTLVKTVTTTTTNKFPSCQEGFQAKSLRN